MKMRKLAIVLVSMLVLSLTACSNTKALEAAQAAVDSYNAAVEEYNMKVSAFNEVATQVNEANSKLQGSINAAQDAINKGEEPFDENTLTELKTAMSDASSAKKGDAEILSSLETLSVSEEMKSKELKEIEEKATAEIENVKAMTIPSTPEVPDYSEFEQAVQEKLKAYENSIQGMKQVTAPTDEFVMERLQRIETITEMDAVTPDHDPNGQLNKQGGYIGCIYFEDTQVDRSKLYIKDGKDNVIDIGTDGGGAIEIFKTAEEAATRDTYLGSFDGMGMLASGSHYLVGTCLVRTSNELNGTQQLELTEQIKEALIAVDGEDQSAEEDQAPDASEEVEVSSNEDESGYETTQLYSDFFEPYAEQVGTLLVDGFQSSAEEKFKNYSVEYTEGSEEDNWTYKITNENGEYVSIWFSPTNVEEEDAGKWIWALTLITYNKEGEKEISVRDDYHAKAKPIYSTWKSDRDPKNMEVNSLKELEDFLYGD